MYDTEIWQTAVQMRDAYGSDPARAKARVYALARKKLWDAKGEASWEAVADTIALIAFVDPVKR